MCASLTITAGYHLLNSFMLSVSDFTLFYSQDQPQEGDIS